MNGKPYVRRRRKHFERWCASMLPRDGLSEVRAIIHRAVSRKAALFQAFPEFKMEDLRQECLAKVLRDWHLYDPARGGWSTFVYRLAANQMLDLWGSRIRRANREAKVAVVDSVEDPPPDAGLDGELVDWLGVIHRYALRVFPVADRRGRKWFTLAQAVCCSLLMHRLRLSTRGVALLLHERPDLCRAMLMRHVPDQMWFWRARKFATDNLRLPNRGVAGIMPA